MTRTETTPRMTPIETAVLPLKATAIQRAEQEAAAMIERVRAILKEAGDDLNRAAPYPRSTAMAPDAFKRAVGRHRLLRSLTTSRQATGRLGHPNYADLDSSKCARFIEEAKTAAATEYDLFVAKLGNKIGPTTCAVLEGNHVWGHSILRVTKADGTTESWKTQMIVNCSKLGKLFNQFPTRKVA